MKSDSLKSDSFGQSGNSLKSSTDTSGNARASGSGGNSLFAWARKMMGGGDPVPAAETAKAGESASKAANATASNASSSSAHATSSA